MDRLNENFELAPRLYLNDIEAQHKFPIKKIRELCTIHKGTASAKNATPGQYPLITTAENFKTSCEYKFDDEAIGVPLISSTGHGHASIKRVYYIEGKFDAANIIAVLQIIDKSVLSPKFLVTAQADW